MTAVDSYMSNLSELIQASTGMAVDYKIGKNLEQRLTGRFYTHERIGRSMAKDIARRLVIEYGRKLKIIDPFCGDGRLICWLIEELHNADKFPESGIDIVMWDCDEVAVKTAKSEVGAVLSKYSTTGKNTVLVDVVDSFSQIIARKEFYDICITNPPWETIKPDSRELSGLDEESRAAYVLMLKEKVFRLEKWYPYSKPTRKFSGWGANLARCGIEASLKTVIKGGLFGVVAPASIFGDQISAALRIWLFTTNSIEEVNYYSAGARLFEGVDQSAVYFVGVKEFCENTGWNKQRMTIVQHPDKLTAGKSQFLHLDYSYLEKNEFSIGFSSFPGLSEALPFLLSLPALGDYEGNGKVQIKLGRELDETRVSEKLCDAGRFKFLKGRQVSRYFYDDTNSIYLKSEVAVPASANLLRVVWRDVARQSSARRMIASIVPAGYVTGNSLNVLFLKVGNDSLIKAFVAILNSLVFEAQVRSMVSTNHLSVGAIRKIRVPKLSDELAVIRIAALVDEHLQNPSSLSAAKIELDVADWYGLPQSIYEQLLEQFELKVPEDVAEIKALIAVRREYV